MTMMVKAKNLVKYILGKLSQDRGVWAQQKTKSCFTVVYIYTDDMFNVQFPLFGRRYFDHVIKTKDLSSTKSQFP